MQQAALLPAQMATRFGEFFDTREYRRVKNTNLKADLLPALLAQQAQIAATTEEDRQQKLLQISQTSATKVRTARVVYLRRDPFSQKTFVNRAASQSFEPGSAVIDEWGLFGQPFDWPTLAASAKFAASTARFCSVVISIFLSVVNSSVSPLARKFRPVPSRCVAARSSSQLSFHGHFSGTHPESRIASGLGPAPHGARTQAAFPSCPRRGALRRIRMRPSNPTTRRKRLRP